MQQNKEMKSENNKIRNSDILILEFHSMYMQRYIYFTYISPNEVMLVACSHLFFFYTNSTPYILEYHVFFTLYVIRK